MQAFLDACGSGGNPLVQARSFHEARLAFVRLQSEVFTGMPAVIEDTTLQVGPTGTVDIRILRPPKGNGCYPIVLYLHGGCWVMGGRDTHDRLLRELAAGARAAIVFADYSLAPEAQYPVQIEQAYAVLKHVAENACAFDLDASRIAIAGDGAGGAMAAAVSLLAKQRRGPELTFQLLFCPVTGDVAASGSYEAFKDGPWLTRDAISRCLDAAFPTASCRREITAFPLNASPAQLNDLPAALVIVAENDILRDEGEAYASSCLPSFRSRDA